MTLLVFFLIISLLVFIHELGHFMAAKRMGVKVEEFGMGLPPKVWSKKFGETEYSFNLLPIGGFVRILGEDDENEVVANDPRSFSSKKPWQRIFILVAGVLMNFILAIGLYYIVLGSNGFKSQAIPLIFENYTFKFGDTHTVGTVVTSFSEGSPAAIAGVLPGEAVIEIDNEAVYSVSDIRRVLADKVGQVVNVSLMDIRDNQKSIRTIEITPVADETGAGVLGTYLTKAVTLDYSKGQNRNLAGPMHAYNVLDFSRFTLGEMIRLSFETRDPGVVSSGVSGPVGVYSVVDGIMSFTSPGRFMILLDFIALMSLSLAFMNILPFPALDGGRVVFVLIEMIFGKKVAAKHEVSIHRFGMIALLSFIVLITIKDVLNILPI